MVRAAITVVILVIAITSLTLPGTAPSAGAATASAGSAAATSGAIAARSAARRHKDGRGHKDSRRISAAVHLRRMAWRWALRQQGKPYLWGGTGPYGYDCSGLVYAAYRAAGLRLPRTTYEMLSSWYLVRIPKSRARRGDLAFFGAGHVELYRWGPWTYGAQDTGTFIGFHRMNPYWHPTMYFRIRL